MCSLMCFLYTYTPNFHNSGILFKIVANDSYVEECLKAKQMLESFSNFASIENLKKYEAEITSYISSIKQFKGFEVKVHLLSPYDACNRDVPETHKSIKDTDSSAARMGLSPTLMECEMYLPRPMRSHWKVQKNIIKTHNARLVQKFPSFLKWYGCFGRLGDFCILKNLQSGEMCKLQCKWHGQYDIVDKDSNANISEACSQVPKELPVFKKAWKGKYPHICNSKYSAVNRNVTYWCATNTKKEYYVFRKQTELELRRHS